MASDIKTFPSKALQPSVSKNKSDKRVALNRRASIRWLKRVLLALVAAAAAYALLRAWIPKPVAVDVGEAKRATLQVFVEEDGRTRVRERYLVAAPLSGTLRRIALEVGDLVSRGEVLARVVPPAPILIDSRSRAELEAQLLGAVARRRQADAALARASAARDLAVIEAKRARKLAPEVMSESERDQYLTQERVAAEEYRAALQQRSGAAAEVQAVRASLGLARSREVSEVEVRAPTRGRVLRVLQESEGPIAMGTPLVEIGDTGELEVVVDVLSSDAVAIRPGAPIWIEQWGGAALHGRVTRVEPAAFTHISALGVEEQRTNVVAQIDELPDSLGDGYRIEARILTWEGQDVLVIPASAVFRRGAGWAAYVAEGSKARLREIGVGHRGRHQVEVKSGLEEGARVVLYPGEKLRDGASIRQRHDPALP